MRREEKFDSPPLMHALVEVNFFSSVFRNKMRPVLSPYIRNTISFFLKICNLKCEAYKRIRVTPLTFVIISFFCSRVTPNTNENI